MNGFLATGVAALTIATAVVAAAGTANAQTTAGAGCTVALEDPRPAYTPNGIRLGDLVGEIRGDDEAVTAHVIESGSGPYGIIKSRHALPPEFVTIAAGRALVKVRGTEDFEGFPKPSC